jgi:hypothetical protein
MLLSFDQRLNSNSNNVNGKLEEVELLLLLHLLKVIFVERTYCWWQRPPNDDEHLFHLFSFFIFKQNFGFQLSNKKRTKNLDKSATSKFNMFSFSSTKDNYL